MTSAAFAHSGAPHEARVFIISPKDGAHVFSPVSVQFGIEGMAVAAAGQALPRSGHHHLLVDLDTLPDFSQPLPKNEHVLHFGGGQTEATIKLAPGKHTLQLLFADGLHRVHKPPVMSKRITVFVN